VTKLKTGKSDSRQFVFVAKKIINHCLPRPKLRLYGGLEILIGLIISPHVSFVASARVAIDQPQNVHIYERISTCFSQPRNTVTCDRWVKKSTIFHNHSIRPCSRYTILFLYFARLAYHCVTVACICFAVLL